MLEDRKAHTEARLLVGWAEEDITPPQPVLLAGQFHARLSEGAADRLQATAWAIESGSGQAVFVGCDVISVSDELLDAVIAVLDRQAVAASGLDPRMVVLHATHTHTAPESRIYSTAAAHVPGGESGMNLGAMPIADYVSWAAERIARAVVRAWTSRAPGGVAYGLGHAVVGHNRRWVNDAERATMYGLVPAVYDTFRHIEGYEDHSVNVAAVYDGDDRLTGVVVNVPCPSQVSEQEFTISADYWHETRAELRRRFGQGLFVLPQCSAAGDQAPRPLYGKEAHERMLRLKGRTQREEIAYRLADAVEDVVARIGEEIDRSPGVLHRVEMAELPMNRLSEADALEAGREADRWREEFERERGKLEAQPELRESPRWYRAASYAYGRMNWYRGVMQRYERQLAGAKETARLHVVRLGDIAFATNPYELYLDFGVQLKTRSPTAQTFIVQLAGAGTYMPSPRSVGGGGYGSVPASNPIGPEGGQLLVDTTVRTICALWEEERSNT